MRRESEDAPKYAPYGGTIYYYTMNHPHRPKSTKYQVVGQQYDLDRIVGEFDTEREAIEKAERLNGEMLHYTHGAGVVSLAAKEWLSAYDAYREALLAQRGRGVQQALEARLDALMDAEKRLAVAVRAAG